MRICGPSSVFRETQIQLTIRYHFVRQAKLKSPIIPSLGGDIENTKTNSFPVEV